MAPRILFLDHAAVLGGAELFLLDVAKGFREQSEVVLLEDGPLRGLLAAAGVTVSVMEAGSAMKEVGRGGKGLAQLLALPGVLRLARRVAKHAKECDVLFANSQKALVVGAVAAVISGKPLVWYLHDILTASHFSALNRRVSVFLANKLARRVIANSQASRNAFIAAGGRAAKCTVVYNGIAAERFEDRSNGARDTFRRELGVDGQQVVGVFSRLAPWKGQHVLLDALPHLSGVHAVIVGAPLFGDEVRYEEELKAQAERLGIAQRVHFLGFRDDIPELLHAVDVVVHTSIAPEPFGRVIVEGMLAGKPVVATKAGGACEIIQDGVTGRLVKPGDASELLGALQELFGNPILAAKMGVAGQQSAEKRLTIATMVEAIGKEVDGVICAESAND